MQKWDLVSGWIAHAISIRELAPSLALLKARGLGRLVCPRFENMAIAPRLTQRPGATVSAYHQSSLVHDIHLERAVSCARDHCVMTLL